MKNNFKILSRTTIINGMKTLLFTIPICLITDKLYISKFGNYNIYWNMDYIFNFFAHQKNQWLFCFGVFCVFFLGAFILEQYIIPAIVILLLKPSMIPDKAYKIADNILKETLNFPLLNIKKVQRNEIVSNFMFVPVTLILWFIYINNIWGYVSIILLIVVFRYVFKILKSLYQ